MNIDKKLTWCYLVNDWIKQDIICLTCNKCELRLKEIEEANNKIMKYLGVEK